MKSRTFIPESKDSAPGPGAYYLKAPIGSGPKVSMSGRFDDGFIYANSQNTGSLHLKAEKRAIADAQNNGNSNGNNLSHNVAAAPAPVAAP
eukprot:EW704283.1.p3 GENE.EW704283.1~~EW704283.1.p3  ORF type:complete len:101 (+),score=24.74 EW704283.1:33-305(+)